MDILIIIDATLLYIISEAQIEEIRIGVTNKRGPHLRDRLGNMVSLYGRIIEVYPVKEIPTDFLNSVVERATIEY